MPTLNDLLTSVLERGSRLIEWAGGERETPQVLADLSADLLSSKGEATGVALAARILKGYSGLDAGGRAAFFRIVADDYDPEPDAVVAAAKRYAKDRTAESLADLSAAAEAKRFRMTFIKIKT